jgi:prepilin-type N-terminal cleavage/methylation domain-containing protein
MLKNKNKKGFSLIELIIAIFIFTILMITTAGIFSGFFSGYRKARATQGDLENAQFAMNYMAKTLRTSGVKSPTVLGTVSDITVFDYSQSKCVQFFFDSSNVLKYRIGDKNDPDEDHCSQAELQNKDSSGQSLTNVLVIGSFWVVPSLKSPDPPRLGKITIEMQVCPSNTGATDCTNSNDKVNIQTSVALRDYSNTGLY